MVFIDPSSPFLIAVGTCAAAERIVDRKNIPALKNAGSIRHMGNMQSVPRMKYCV